MGANLVTRDEYKDYVGIKSPNEDTIIDSLIPGVSQLVKTLCRRTFVDRVDDPVSEIFNGGFPDYFLTEAPLVGTATIESSSDYGQTWTAMTQYTDWVYDSNRECFVFISGPLTEQLNGYRATYTSGFEDGIPEDLKLAVMDLITYYRKNDNSVHSSKPIGSNSIQIEYITKPTLPSAIQRIIDQYCSDYL